MNTQPNFSLSCYNRDGLSEYKCPEALQFKACRVGQNSEKDTVCSSRYNTPGLPDYNQSLFTSCIFGFQTRNSLYTVNY